MVRQAHTYLVGAVGGTTLIAVAIAVFVMLVSAQVFRDWPIAALGDGGSQEAAVSKAQPAEPIAAGAKRGTDGGAAADDDGRAGAGLDGRADLPAIGAGTGSTTGGRQDAIEPGAGGGEGAGGGQAGADSPPSTSASNSGGSGASNPGGAAGGGGGKAGGAGSTSSPSGQVTETVNDTVGKVDETALGGTLGDSGVTEATEGVVNGVAGPESTVGKVVDEAAGAVGGLLGGNP